MSFQKKCPACGHVGATAVSVYSDILRCGYCGLTDSGSQFKDASGPAADEELHPNLARAGISGMIVGPDITREDVERLANAFGCTLVEKT